MVQTAISEWLRTELSLTLTSQYDFSFGQAAQNGCTLLVFHKLKTHPGCLQTLAYQLYLKHFW